MADKLAKLASSTRHPSPNTFYEVLHAPSAATKAQGGVSITAPEITVLDGLLYKGGICAPLLQCVSQKEGQSLLWEIHQGPCGAHQAPQGLIARAFAKVYTGQQCFATCRTSSSATKDASGSNVTRRHRWLHYSRCLWFGPLRGGDLTSSAHFRRPKATFASCSSPSSTSRDGSR